MTRQAHWNSVYESKASADLSWYEPEPAISLRLIDAAGFTAST
jgi:hypothetical protein